MKYILAFLFFSVSIFASEIEYQFDNPYRGQSTKAPLAIFVHGALGNVNSFNDVKTDWQKAGYATLSFSMPGRGNSTSQSDFYGFDDQRIVKVFLSKFIKRNTKRLNLDQVVIYGHSLGGVLAAEIQISSFPKAKLILESAPLSLLMEMREEQKGETFIEKRAFDLKMFSKDQILDFFIDDYTEADLFERSMVGNYTDSSADILFMFGSEDWRYDTQLVNRQLEILAITNPEAKLSLSWFNGDHDLENRSPLSNSVIKQFLSR